MNHPTAGDELTTDPAFLGTPGPVCLAEAVAIEGESAAFLTKLIQGLYHEFGPESPVEIHLTETMAVARWRQMRLWGLEKATIANQIARTAPDVEDNAECAAVVYQSLVKDSSWTEQMGRAEARMEQQYRHALTAFREHRAWRQAQLNLYR